LIGVLEYEMTLTHVCTTNLTEWSLFMDVNLRYGLCTENRKIDKTYPFFIRPG